MLGALPMSKANHIPCWEFYWEEQDQQKEGSYYPLLLGTGEVLVRNSGSFLGPPTQSKKDVEESGEGPAAGS